MAYVTHRQGLYRTGFRPYSNPWHATQLGKTPFDADMWRLGQIRAFTRGGGYGLHGLGDIVPNQSIVTWVGQVSGSATRSVQDVIAAASAALQNDGLAVTSTSGLPFAIFDINIQLSSAATVTLVILVNNGMGYGDPQDIAAIVNHEIFLASGVMPSGAVTVVKAPGAAAAATAAGAGLPTQPTDWGAWLQQNAMWLGLGVLGIFVLPDLVKKVF